MIIRRAIEEVRQQFPIPDYLDGEIDACHGIANAISSMLPTGASVFDFGSGPCDKTAVLQLLGYRCYACDDLLDPWHGENDAREKITAFAQNLGIRFCRVTTDEIPFANGEFDAVLVNSVIEHLHDSPRLLLTDLLSRLKDGGLILITVPNAVNIRKRLDVLRGRTNLPKFADYYWHPSPWRGHVREYTVDDLRSLSRFLNLTDVSIDGCHFMLSRLPRLLRRLYCLMTIATPGWRDSWMMTARKQVAGTVTKARPSSAVTS